ncbi:FG-GAP and VCBS repeat-containing protein [Streptomyces sp. AP-93]|uniref:FG-GAP and VCBS repeat-containing protein n=1 Tax=Streptomyces sp. AP-93 TaxID=2929048 RepID=UPI001FAFFE2D|nr:FG-GAP and VCBS repeat-containing protein [Streptomyces sp. AP-93]MCJ0871890.1 FG-GAP and VCBS repeat-containing protein [Streptomyces sp. AP-93]
MRVRCAVAAALCAAVSAGPAFAQPMAASGAVLPGDFNSDGYPDAVIGAADGTVNGVAGAGYMTTLNGSSRGLTTSGGKLLSRANLPGDPLPAERFGSGLGSSGDLNDDGYADQVVIAQGSPHMMIVWGGKSGLSGGTRVRGIHPLMVRVAKSDVGDINGDGHADIVVEGGFADRAGQGAGLALLYGPFNRTNGYPASSAFHPTQKKDGILPGQVTMGDVNHDGKADVVVQGMTVTADGAASKQTVALFLGSKDGLAYAGQPFGEVYVGDIAIGDLNRDGYGDFVGGMSGTDGVPGGLGGTVAVAFGGPQGMSTTLKPRQITQDTPGVPGTGEESDAFGRSVAVGDTDGDGYADLAIGVSGETGTDTTATKRAGAVTILRGSASGVTTVGARNFTQDSAGVPDTSQPWDHFGAVVSLIDGNSDGKADLVVGAWHDNNYAGRAWVLPAAPGGITGTGSISFTGTTFGAPGGRAFYGAAVSD